MLSSLAGVGLLAGGVFGVATVIGAGPAVAGPCSPNLVVSPVAEKPPTSTPVISGTAVANCSDGSYHLNGPVQISISSASDPGPSGVPHTDSSFTAAVAGNGTWSATVPAPFTYNGGYSATVTANSTGPAGPESTTRSVNFTVAAPPAKPTGLVVTPIAGGGYHLSWKANSEPDLVSYVVLRTGGSGPLAKALACTPGRGTCATTYADTSAAAGTAYSYQIGADRYGATQSASDEVYSGPSDAVSTTAPTPGPGGSPGTSPGSSSSSGAAGFTGPPRYVIPGPGFAFNPNTNVLSGLGSVSAQPDPSSSLPGALETGAPTSGGFNAYLPYPKNPASGGGLVAGATLASNQAQEAKVRQMSSIALALILVAVAGELLGLRRRMLETLPANLTRARHRVGRRHN